MKLNYSLVAAVSLVVLSNMAVGGVADRIAAIVGRKPILESEVRELVVFFRLMSGDTLTPDSVVRREALNRLIDEALLAAQAERESVVVTREELTQAVNEQWNALKGRFESEAEFRAALAAEGLTERQLKERMNDEVRRNLISRRLLEKSGLTQIYISPTEVERFYNEHRDSIARVPGQVKLAHILIMIKPADSAENAVRTRAWEVLELIARGGDFPTLARSFSEDPLTRGKGGDWGWRRLSDLSQEFQLVLTQLQEGQVSPPFRARNGYWILKKEGSRGEQVRFRGIFFPVPVTRADTVRARRQAELVRSRAIAGVPFDSLARIYSDDPETAQEGGYLGDFLTEGLMPPFDRVLAQLNTGDVSEPVLSEHGFHIIKVIEKQPERLMTLGELQDEIRNYLYQQEFSRRLRRYLERIRREIFVEIK